MEAAKYAIDNDNDFNLEHLPRINGLLQFGLTLFVDKDFPNYNDMTLTQYSIAKRKPITLRFLLDRSKKLGIEDKDILYPKTSNTRSSLLKLALEFGSKGFYDTVDNKCLDVLLEVFKDAISSEVSITEAPLIQAIKYKNDDAIKSLIKSGADFFYPLEEKDTETDYYHCLEMPIMSLFKLNNNIDQLEEIFDNLLTKTQKISIFYRTQNLKVDNKYFFMTLNDLNLLEVKQFLTKQWKVNDEAIRTYANSPNQNPNPEPEPEPQPEPGPDSDQCCERCGGTEDLVKTNNNGCLCQRCRDDLRIYE